MAAAALVMSACTQDVAEQGGYGAGWTDEVQFAATSTRTAMSPNADGGLDVTWVGGEDQVGIFAYDESELAESNLVYTANESGSYTTFAAEEAVIKWGTGSHDFYAYYPVSENAMHYTAVYTSIPAVQTQSGGRIGAFH